MSIAIGRLCSTVARLCTRCTATRASKALMQSLGNVGPNVEMACDVVVDYPERAQFGDWVYVGPEGRFFARGGLTIDDHTIIGPRVTIMTSMHNYRDAQYVPYDEVELLGPVKIGEASWIGFGALLLPGVVLGRGCIVGAGAVVTKSFGDGAIVAGNPARLIGSRDLNHLEDCLASARTYLKAKVTQKLEKVERPRSHSKR